jgi:hypothetical protein
VLVGGLWCAGISRPVAGLDEYPRVTPFGSRDFGVGWGGERPRSRGRSLRAGWVGWRLVGWPGGLVGRLCRVSRTLLQGRGAGKLLLTSRQVREKMVRG